MIKLDNIRKDGDFITCTAYVEDSKEPVSLSVNIASEKISSSPLPKGYEYCKAHINMAKLALLKMAKSGVIEPKRTVMWY